MNKETDQLVAEFVAQGGRPQDWRPAYSIAPTVNAPIVREWQDEGTIEREITGPRQLEDIKAAIKLLEPLC